MGPPIVMASTALPLATDSLKHRMDQFLAAAAAGMRAPPENETDGANSSTGGRDAGAGDMYQYHETSATSGSNSGEEDDRESGEISASGKRLGSHLNGFSSKKRRKQSKPIRIGAGDEGGQSSPTSGDRRYSEETDEDKREDGEKETPLNLSSKSGGDEEEGELKGPPGLRVLGAELMQTPGLEGLKLPGGVPNIPTSLYQSMLPFGLPPFPFPFPPSSQPSVSSATTPGKASIGSNSRQQIFNPEAYCELCNKEFCNKYFLKTHKANKHGIYSDAAGGGGAGGGPGGGNANSRSPQPVTSAGGPTPPAASDAALGPPTPNSQAGSPFSGAFIAANMGSLRPPFLPLSPGASPSPNSGGQQQSKDGGRDEPSRGSNSDDRSGSPLSSRPPPASSASQLFSPSGMPGFRQNLEERERLMQRDKVDRELGELRKSLESPRSSIGALGGFNPLLFGGIPPLDSMRKEDDMKKEGTKRSLPNAGNQKGPFSADKLRQMGVINADAFCEICCKEFCNKYFLRVHKLKKHGICSPDLPPEKVQKILNQMAKEAGKSGNPPPPIVRPPMMPGSDKMPMPPLATGSMNIRPPGLMNIPNMEPVTSLRDGAPAMPPLLHLGGDKERSRDGRKDKEQDRERSSSRSSETRAPLPPSESEIIRINEDSEEGIVRRQKSTEKADTERKEGGEDSPSSQAAAAAAAAAAAGEDLQRLQSMIMELNSGKAKANVAGDGTCKVCGKDMENKYFLRAHMMNEHGVLHMEEPPQLPIRPDDSLMRRDSEDPVNGVEGSQDFAAKFLQQMQKGLMPPLEPGDEQSFLERVKNELAAGNIKGKMDKDPNRRPASLSRSYCEICKKELCNKYFMKTHMLKMHGINIEDRPGNGVSCHICKKDLCSKYFLRVHMQNCHGIVEEDGPPLPPGMKENGNLFQGLFPMGGPPPELLGLPTGDPSKDKYFSRLLGEQSELSKEKLDKATKEGKHGCTLCGEIFPEIVALQVHIIKSHGAFPPEGVFSGKEAASPEASHPSPKKQEEEQLATDEPSKNDSRERTAEAREESSPKETSTPKGDKAESLGLDKNALAMAGISPEMLKQFPHLEMLQRHMLTQQLPGLLSPLLSGFPGFPNPLQHLLTGTNGKEDSPPEVGKKEEEETPKKSSPGRKKRFKCSKCKQKFKHRSACLKHIQEVHSIRRKLTFSSPLKSQPKAKARAQYVKQLMDLLKVPTTRGTPQVSPSSPKAKHIMQPFLLKTDEDEGGRDANDNNFVPSLVYLPVAKRVSEPVTVSFSLTPS